MPTSADICRQGAEALGHDCGRFQGACAGCTRGKDTSRQVVRIYIGSTGWAGDQAHRMEGRAARSSRLAAHLMPLLTIVGRGEGESWEAEVNSLFFFARRITHPAAMPWLSCNGSFEQKHPRLSEAQEAGLRQRPRGCFYTGRTKSV